MTLDSLEAIFDRRVRVRAPLAECGRRRFMWTVARPEPCRIHGRRHAGDLQTAGHHGEEAGVFGEISGHLGGMNDGHPWIVRYDHLLQILWPDGQYLIVNGGTYRLEELELL